MTNLMICLEVAYDNLSIVEAQEKFLKDLCEWVDKYEKDHHTELQITDVYAVAGRKIEEADKVRR